MKKNAINYFVICYMPIINRHCLIALLLIISNCHSFYQPATLNLEVPKGPPEYRAGWHDGCQSALSTRKFANSWVYDLNLGNGIYQDNSLYQSGWSTAFSVCNLTSSIAVGFHPFRYGPLE